MIVAIMTTALSGTAWAETTETLTISSYATTNGWTNQAQYLTATVGSITFTATGGSNTGKYYTTDNSWRFYANETAKLTISVPSGSTLVSVKPTFTSKDNGTLVYNNSTVTSASTVSVSGNSAEFTISQSSGSKGKIFFTEIEVTYSTGASSAVATTTTIDATGITNKDVYVGTAAGSLSATVKDSNNETISGASVTWSSSNENVATVASNGTVTLVAAGTTNITASYAGVANQYLSSVSDAYVLTVTDSTPFEGGDVTFVAGTDVGSTSGNNSPDAVTKSGVTMSSTDAAFATAEYRLYSGSTTTFSTSSGKITKIVFTKTGSYSLSSLSTETGTYNSSTGTWTGNVQSVVFDASAQVRLSQIVVTVTSADALAAPAITGTTPFVGSTTVTITAEEGASIYYTVDGTDPTTSSTLYSAPFTINATTTIKAIAVKDSKTSEIASTEFVKTVSYKLNEISSLTDGSYIFEFENAVVTYINGSYVYIEDANGAILYYKSNSGFSVGQVLNGYATVTWKIYTGQPEATAISGIEPVAGSVTPTPTTATIANLLANVDSYMSKFVKLEKVTAEASGSNFVLTQNGSTIAFFGRNSAAVEDGKSYDIIGFLSKHNDVYQFMVQTPDHITELGVPEKSTTPTITVTGDETKTVTITAETGATIYYTTDGSDPTTESDVYTAALTFSEAGSYTIKAVALEDGKTLSLVATETFSISGPNYISLAAGDVVTTTTFPSFSGSGYKTLSDYMIVLSNSNSNPWSVTDGMKSGNDLQLKASSGRLVSPEIHTPYGYTVTVAYTSDTAMTLTSGDNTATGAIADENLGTPEVSLTVASTAASFTLATGSKYAKVQGITIKAIEPYAPATITLNASGYATFASTSPVDLDETADCTAWAITAIEGTSITFTQVEGVVAAGTGLLLKGAAGATITPEYSTSAGSPVTGNLLEAIVTPTDIVADQYYGLSGKTFVKVNAGQVPAGKALLPASALGSNPVKAFTFVFEEDATGISLMEDGRSQMEGGVIYNIAGQRISKMQKGINIVNGKKILK